MILRRPYAFLIKHFRLIHLIITAIFAFVVLQIRDIYKYLTSVINDSINRYNALEYINYSIYIYILLALGLCTVVFLLLKYKDKPRKIYIFTLVVYLIIAIFMLVLFNYMRGFNNSIVDQKTIRMYRDILFMLLLFQYYIIVFMLIRGLGFDIKRFNFGKDVQELKATAEDAEEVEINTQINTTNVARRLRKQGREFGYFFKEYKIYIIVILSCIFVFGCYKAYNYYSNKLKIYGEGQVIGSFYQLMVKDSYYYIDGNNKYVIINFAIRKDGAKDKFNTLGLSLQVGKDKYLVNKNICYKFSSLGTCYKKQYVSGETNNYIITYEVNELNIEKSYLLYSESYDKTYKIKLDMKVYENE